MRYATAVVLKAQFQFFPCDVQGMTALHYAADRGFSDIVKLLVERGADTQALDSEGQTPLSLAELCEHDDIIAFLRC